MTFGENIVKSLSMEKSIHEFITTIEPYLEMFLTAPFMIGAVVLLYITFKEGAASLFSRSLWIKLKDIFRLPPVYCPNCSCKMEHLAMWVDNYYKCWNCGQTLDVEDVEKH